MLTTSSSYDEYLLTSVVTQQQRDLCRPSPIEFIIQITSLIGNYELIQELTTLRLHSPGLQPPPEVRLAQWHHLWGALRFNTAYIDGIPGVVRRRLTLIR